MLHERLFFKIRSRTASLDLKMNWERYVSCLGLLYYWLSVVKISIFCFRFRFYSENLRYKEKCHYVSRECLFTECVDWV